MSENSEEKKEVKEEEKTVPEKTYRELETKHIQICRLLIALWKISTDTAHSLIQNGSGIQDFMKQHEREYASAITDVISKQQPQENKKELVEGGILNK